MKKIILCTVGVLLLLIFLDRCTTVNISTLFISSKYKTYPDLKDGTASANFEIKQLFSYTYCVITYDPVHRFFLLNNSYEFQKVDAKGNQVFKMELKDLDLIRYAPYAFDSTGVYDLSKDQVVKEVFKRSINPDQKMGEAEWEKMFASYYQQAQVVVYGADSYPRKGNPIYLKINGGWIAIKTRKQDDRTQNENLIAEITFKGYPAKYEPMFLLKDVESRTYSNIESTTDDYLNTYFTVKLKEKEIRYPDEMKVNLLAYEKDEVGFRAGYTDLPLSWSVTAYYCIHQSGEALNFKTFGNQYIGLSKPLDTYLTLFTVPQQFRTQTAVSFLRYKLIRSDDTKGAGYYIIKNK